MTQGNGNQVTVLLGIACGVNMGLVVAISESMQSAAEISDVMKAMKYIMF